MRPASSILPTLIALPLNGCLQPPELALDEAPTPPDLGTIDTWAPVEDPPLQPDPGPDPDGGLDDGPPSTSDEGGGSGAPLDAPDPTIAQLRISEALIDPEGKDGALEGPEWIEIHNPGPEPVHLDSLIIRALSWPTLDADELGLAGVTLAVDGLLIIRRWATDVAPLPAPIFDPSLIEVGFSHSGGLRNDDGAVGLSTVEGPIDALIYGAPQRAPFDDPTQWSGDPAPAPDSGWSLCRLSTDDHDDSTDWSICNPSPGSVDIDSPSGSDDEASASEGTSDTDITETSDTGDEPAEPDPLPDPIAEGALVIVEVLANASGPSSDEKHWEFIELINISDNQVELADARILDDVAPDAPGSDPLVYRSGDGGCDSLTCLAPGQRALIVGNQWSGDAGSTLVLETDDSTIADGGLTNTEPVVLRDALGSVVTTFRVWPEPASDPVPGDGQSLHRVEPTLADEPSNWELAGPTPGT